MPRIVDLSLTLRAGMRGVDWEPASTIAEEGWNTRTLHLYSHAGTHLDAPRHFVDQGATLESVSLEKCIGPAQVLDLTFLAPQEYITVAHLDTYADLIVPGARLLLQTGWSDHADDADYRTHFPRVSVDAAEWLAGREIALLGVEMPSVADVQNKSELTQVHQILLRADIVIVEGLANLDALRDRRVTLVALPLKIDGGDGSPIRAIAIENLS